MAGFGHKAPSDKLNIAVVGIGGMGNANLKAVKETENIVDEMAVEIIPVLEEIKFIIKKWDVAKNGTVERIIMQANDLKAEYESLIEVIMIFKKQNIKRVFKIK